MLRNIAIASLLLGYAYAVHLEYLKIESTKELPDEILGSADETEDFLNSGRFWCSVCKRVMEKIKKRIGRNESVDAIRAKLHSVCDKLRFFKEECKDIVEKHIKILVDEFSTDDSPQRICTKISFCKSENMTLFRDFPPTEQLL